MLDKRLSIFLRLTLELMWVDKLETQKSYSRKLGLLAGKHQASRKE